MKLTLTTKEIIADGCFSELLHEDGSLVCYTCERTFDDIRPIIPVGEYACRKTRFVRGGYDTFEITGVEGHSRLLFHRGNVEDDSLGCILVGTSRGLLGGKAAVLGSKNAFALFWAIVNDCNEFMLSVEGR